MGGRRPQTRRKRGEGGVFQKANGLWVGRIEGDPDATTGKRTRIEVTSMDFATMMDKLETAKREMRTVGYVSDKQKTLKQWGEEWLTEQSHRLRPKTWGTYASLLRRHVFPKIGDKKIAAIQPADIRRVRDGIRRAGLSGATALQTYRVMSHCLEDARRDRLVTENVCTRVDPPEKVNKTKGAFTVDETRAILLAAAEHDNGSRYITQMLSGMRQSELLGLTLDDLDLEAGEAYVRWQLMEMTWQHGCGEPGHDGRYPCGYKKAALCSARSWRAPDDYNVRPLTTRYALAEPKSASGVRPVPLIEPALLAIRHHLATTTAPNPHRLVWQMPDGSPIPHKTDQAAWREIITACGLPPDRTTHWARHSAATRLLEAGVDTKVVGEIVGHGSTAVTKGYQHVSSALAHDAMRRFAELLA